MLGCIGFLLVVVIMTFIILIIKRIVIANSNNQTTRRYRNIHVNRPSKNRSSKVIPHLNRKPIEPSVRHPSYKEASGNGFLSTFLNKGNYGEYLTYKELTRLKGYHRVMTNLYIPTKSGKSTELDLVMISQKGIFVLESKNYSGWIFGDEGNKNWMQILPGGKKFPFFNPIWQNSGHIQALKAVVGIEEDACYHSYIIFSERCTLKQIQVTSPNVVVIKRNSLIPTIKQTIQQTEDKLTTKEIDQLYERLREYTLVDAETKQAHIRQVSKR